MATTGQYSHEELSAIWFKASIVQGYDPNVYRKDSHGSWIEWGSYGQTTKYGWEVDHMIPLARNGPHNLNNWQPLQWENNRRKSDNHY